MSEELDALLNSQVLEDAPAQAEETVEETEPTAEADSEPEPTKGDNEGETPAPKKEESEEKAHWQYEAYKDEKRKRQELERKLEELQQKEPEPEDERPDPLYDANGYDQYVQSQIKNSTVQVKVEMSNYYATKEFGAEVVEEKLAAFKELAAANPELSKTVLASASPVHEAIIQVNKAERAKKLEHVDDIEAHIREEVRTQELEAMRQQIREEIEAEVLGKKAKRDSVTPSLNKVASGADSSSNVELTLDDVLGGR